MVETGMNQVDTIYKNNKFRVISRAEIQRNCEQRRVDFDLVLHSRTAWTFGLSVKLRGADGRVSDSSFFILEKR